MRRPAPAWVARLLWASEYMLPQRRLRSWAILVHLPTFRLTRGEGELLLSRVFETIKSLQVPPRSLSKFLLSQSSPRVQRELERRATARRESAPLSQRTLDLHIAFMESKGISRDLVTSPPASLSGSQWFQTLQSREREVVAFAFRRGALSVDCGQAINRCSENRSELLPTVTPGGKVFLMFKEASRPMCRLLLGYEALALQGYPVEQLPLEDDPGCALAISDSQMRDLAGNAFPSTCLMACFLGIFAHAPVGVRTEKR